MQPDRLVDEQVVSEITGIKIRTLRKWRQQGRGPSVRRIEGRLVRYSLQGVQEWMRDQPPLKSDTVQRERSQGRGSGRARATR
jgi:phage terminase Nu1 subunit (DNA packaging protein)